MVSTESPQFGKHFVGDCCPQTHDNSGITGFLRGGILDFDRANEIHEIIALSKRYGLSAFRKFHLEADARGLIKRFILIGGNQEEPLSNLSPPAVFDPNNYPANTLVRLTWLVHEFSPPEDILREWRRKDQDKYFGSHQILGDTHIAKTAVNLGVVTATLAGKGKVLVMFWGKEDSLVEDKVRRTAFMVDPIRLGEWCHHGGFSLKIPFIDAPFFLDIFLQPSEVEVLEGGLREVQRVNLPSLALSPVHS